MSDLIATSSFTERTTEAVNNPELRKSFRGAMDFLIEKRLSVFDDATELAQLRRLGNRIRSRALSKLPRLLEQLETNLQANGIQVHWAETSDEANRIIHHLVSSHNASKVIKGKSMVSEEIEMNDYLGQRQIDCLESDMGEYIIQLDNEKPSHIIMPAIHKSARDVAKTFAKNIPGTDYNEDVDFLIQTGRKVLREAFYNADIGVSGVNFAVAETGTLCLVENEGNGRMSTTVPDVHIAITGIEKVVELLDDVPPLLSLLTRSATGQAVTTYFNMISSPRKEGEQDGPREVHLVLLDNGRSQAYADEQLRDTLNCIRCGACINHCPVYTRVGGHAYGTVYPGPIGKIISPHLLGLEETRELPSASSLCGACGEVCPVQIPIPEILLRLRQESVHPPTADHPGLRGQGAKYSRREKLLWRGWAAIYTQPALYRAFTAMATTFGRLLPRRITPWGKARTLPQPAAKSLHQMIKQRTQKDTSS
ncbi:LutB/LldF family L-lactate oxidation iron-sulfur protein [Aestuariirhabdus sp. Z084]|uniref:LutB/LldF family L-lactate oxidation iron-sulfur protein n=1 Tax=Aestuariirhabdus haliotis TaxID=2918751 RepID=UPI00201B4296|nr:LutB/LldF family L-lactate oxidation iron-sulfur protein [Aestuariirhabdus haliotis]MCL6416431.1 LutB/LldF family L-lactate oxidation iron-sulfur protein [Aestuariirhabdus haliotis]MCL6420403.1 LutB/LldF family L-lactate oxidation iron-sulfur protein [Aestuariirhabdus haliotis]